MVLITIVTGAYKPTNITVGGHILDFCGNCCKQKDQNTQIFEFGFNLNHTPLAVDAINSSGTVTTVPSVNDRMTLKHLETTSAARMVSRRNQPERGQLLLLLFYVW